MNDLTKENIKIALCNALADDKDLMQKEVATNFGTDPASISYIKNPTQWGKVKAQLWMDLSEWSASGKKLRDYVPLRLLHAIHEKEPEPIPEPSIYDKLEAQEKKAKEKKEVKKKPEPETLPEPEPEPQKEPSVSKGAKKFLKGEKLDTKPEGKEQGFDKELREAIESINNGVIIPIGIHKYSPEEAVISQRFDIEVEVKLRMKEKK